MRKAIAVAAGLVLVAAVNWTIYSRERHLAEGRVVLLELAPVDPRSLMQGDYMALRFQIENSIYDGRAQVDDGRVVVRLDERGVGRFVRRDDRTALAEREVA